MNDRSQQPRPGQATPGAVVAATGDAAGMVFHLAYSETGQLYIAQASAAFCSAHRFRTGLPALADILAVIHPDDRAPLEASFALCASDRAPWLHEYRVMLDSGTVLWFSASALPRIDQHGQTQWAGFVIDITARKLLEEASRFVTARNRLLMRTATDGLHILDSDGYIVEASDNFARLLGYTAVQMAGMHVSAWHEKWNDDGRWRKFQGSEGSSIAFEAVYRRKNGLCFPVEVFASTALFDGRVYISSTSHDVSGRKRNENDLRMAAAAFEAKQCMFITDPVRRVVKINLAFSEQTGYLPPETMGKLPPLFRSGLYDDGYFSAIWKAARSDGFWSGELMNRRKDGSLYPVRASLTAVHRADGAVASYVGTEIDITAEKEAEKRITRLAYYDALTGLPNRRLLQERLTHSVALSRRTGSLGALLFIDLDHFKQLNDSAGHDVGDMLLVQLAKRLLGGLRDADTVARLGGDEFVVVLESLADDAAGAARMANTVSTKILAELNQPYQLAGQRHHCTPSIGFTLFGERDEDVDALFKRADLAMYQAKATGRNGVRFFDLDLRRSQQERLARIDAIKRGLLDGQFELHYQPQLAMNGTVFGAEALARWRHPTLGLLLPAQFIPLAEETGFIVELGQALLRTALQQLCSWLHVPALADTRISVNVSARQFRQRDFVDQVMSALADTGAASHRLTLELTESVLVDNLDDTTRTMHALKAHGIRFSLDDFGVGYSSLSYLKRLPFDQLKIDRAFVVDILRNPKDAAIATTIVSLGKNLGLDVVAEGVESAAQRQWLAAIGCDAYQGYLISEALAPVQYGAFVANHGAPGGAA